MEPLTTSYLWRSAWRILKERRQSILWLLGLGILLPQLLMDFGFDWASLDTAKSLQAQLYQEQITMMGIVNSATGFFSPYLFLTFLTSLVSLAAYFGIIQIIVDWHRAIPTGAGKAFVQGLKFLFPEGFVLVAVGMFFVIMAQVLTAPAFILANLALMAPVIIVSHKKGGLASVWEALSIRYVKGTPYNAWGVFFALISVGAMFYAFMILASLASDLMLNADSYLGLSRDLWMSSNPISPIYVASVLVRNAMAIVAIGFLPALTASMYFTVLASRKLNEA